VVSALIESTLGQVRPARRRWSTVFVGALMLFLASLVLGSHTLLLGWREPPPWRSSLIAALFVVVGVAGAGVMRAGLRGESADRTVGIRVLARVPADIVAWALLLLATMLVALGRVTGEPALATTGALGVARWVSLFAQLAFHEWGHFRAARALGWPVLKVVVGPLALVAAGDRFRLAASRDWRFLFAGAVFHLLPARGAAPRETLRVAAAGPIYTALLGVALALLALVLPHGFWAQVVEENLGIAVFALVTNLIPLRSGGLKSDGLQIRDALRALRRSSAS